MQTIDCLAPRGAHRRRHLSGKTIGENTALIAAHRRIAELETDVAIHRRAPELLGEAVA